MAGITYFLIIAVEKYNGIPDIQYAKADAEGLVKAWQNLGYDPNDFVVLINEHATKTTIESNLIQICNNALKDDRIVVFFAGHGISYNNQNLILPVDANRLMYGYTGISIDWILGHLKKTACERNLLFLDCCHSGFEPGEHIRASTSDFSVEDLATQLKDEIYCVGFASCKSHQESQSHAALKHGIWSHFLIEALSGNAEGIYDKNLLLSHKLQSYLSTETSGFIRKNKVAGIHQTPMVFGSFSDQFIIEDLSVIFEAREAAQKAAALSLTSITIFDTDEGDIKDLPGFDKKKGHFVAEKASSKTKEFVRSISEELIEGEIDDMSEQIKDVMGYTRQEITVEKDSGFGSIDTPAFTYEVVVEQSIENPTEYIFFRTLRNMIDESIINDDRFNKIFQKHFRRISFKFSNKIDVEQIIDNIEAKKGAGGITVKYKPSNTSRARIVFPDSQDEIVIDPYSITITTPRATTPAGLVEAYKKTIVMIEAAKIKLIEPAK